MVTGQRVREILKLKVTSWDKQEQMLVWGADETKNGLQHSIPLSKQATAILKTMTANEHGLYFPSTKRPKEVIFHQAVYQACAAFIRKTGTVRFSPRDLR